MTDFIAIDGEALKDGRYVLLDSSEGPTWAFAKGGLTSKDCFDYLLGEFHAARAKLVAFGLNYDVNMWLKDLPKPLLKILWEKQTVYWRNYRIRWVPRREFSLADTEGRKVRIQEVWGFFQCSFLAALEDWQLAGPATLADMKERREHFTEAALADGSLEKYCRQECESLVVLMQKLEQACVQAGIYPERWQGAGSLASALLKEENVAQHHRHDRALCHLDRGQSAKPLAGNCEVKEAIMRAYHGGRFEIFQAGPVAEAQSVDIRSAYPWALTHLCSLAGAELRQAGDDELAERPGLWRVRWSGVVNGVGAFPVRNDRKIYYPTSGEGVYHSCEVLAAIEAGFEVQVIEGWVLDPLFEERPFAFLDGLYRWRARAETHGEPGGKVLKLAMNAIYGKLAQGYTQKPDALPRWQSYFWAGEVTARVRARMLTLAVQATEPLSIATDGLIARGLPIGDPLILDVDEIGLGGIDFHTYTSLFLAQAGIYSGTRDDGEVVRSRGHFARELDFANIAVGFEQQGLEHVHKYRSRRFVGLGTAINSKRMEDWRRWPTAEQRLSLKPQRKRQREGTLQLLPPEGSTLQPSEPYVPKQDLNESDNPDDLQFHEQPMIEDA